MMLTIVAFFYEITLVKNVYIYHLVGYFSKKCNILEVPKGCVMTRNVWVASQFVHCTEIFGGRNNSKGASAMQTDILALHEHVLCEQLWLNICSRAVCIPVYEQNCYFWQRFANLRLKK